VLNIHNLASVTTAAYPLPVIIEQSLGAATSTLFFVLVAVSIFACGLVIMASGSRLIYAMARDRALWANRLLSKVSPHTAVPVPAVLLVMLSAIITELFSESLEQLLLAAAVLPALIYLLTVVAYLVHGNHVDSRFGTFSLGKWRLVVTILAIIWLTLNIAVLTIPTRFHKATFVTLTICALGAAIYLLDIRCRKLCTRFTNDEPSLPHAETMEQ
jgi:amino acid transporter